MGTSMVDGNIHHVYGAWGPYTNSRESILRFVASNNIIGYTSICDDGNEGRWIIIQPTNTAYIAQGPFSFVIDKAIINEDNWIIGVTLGKDSQFVEIQGLQGKSCFDFFGLGLFWVISKLYDLNGGQSICAPATIPLSCDIATVEVEIDPTSWFSYSGGERACFSN